VRSGSFVSDRDRWPKALRSPLTWSLLLALVLAAAGLLAWRSRAIEVDALQVTARPLQRSLQFSARVKTPARVDIGSTLTGRVDKVRVREGDAVTAGMPLLELESEELRAALAQAQAAMRQAQARTASQQAVARPSADAALLQADAALSTAERELTRTRELVASNFISAARLDEVQRNVDSARAQRDAARAQSQANRRDGPETAGVQAQQLAAQAAVEAARARLAQATLRAPAAGRVITRTVEAGQIVQPGRGLLTLAIDGPTELLALVDERFLGQLRVGQRASVLADAFPQQPFDARLARLAPAVDAQRGAVEVTFTIEGKGPDFLREDMTLSVEAITGERSSALVIPLQALRAVADGGADRAGVLVLEGDRAVERSVTLGLRTLDQAEVTAGLAAGDTVLLDATLKPGTRVRPRLLDAAQALRASAGGTSRDGGASGITSTMSGGSAR
jgi:HlyD family secretion protein